MKPKLKWFQARMLCVLALGIGPSSSQAAAAEDAADIVHPKTSPPIPWTQVVAKAGADYQGDGLGVMPTADGVRLRCVFQRLEGEATREGLWLTSTVEGGQSGRFRVMAESVGRAGAAFGVPASAGGSSESFQRFALTAAEPAKAGTPNHLIPTTGAVEVDGNLVRFLRPGVIEEYTVSMDGVRQDLVVLERPAGAGDLFVGLAVSGARAKPATWGARLVQENSGRKISYSRLRVIDATGKELTARLEVEAAPLASDSDIEPGAILMCCTSGFPTAALPKIPKRLRPSAQGCEARATLSYRSKIGSSL